MDNKKNRLRQPNLVKKNFLNFFNEHGNITINIIFLVNVY